ncbi:hypothetical protein [Stenotrophomonas pigmentata]|uniref:hypothetical protein n=1 Tax=Stenotrophomonas pigmentata TaxID=3055080 RepID=UPI0026F1E0E2|nr:hypothetical protein [Stenotrophomonas sp. 610A2]
MPLTTSGNLSLPIRNIHSAALRGAGIRVTSARIATLRLAPLVLAAHGHLSPQLLHAAAVEQGGMHVSTSAFYNTLSTLTAAGLLPSTHAAHASATPAIVSVQE